MRFVRAVAGLSVCVVVLAPAVSSAAPPQGTITVTGSRTAYAWLTVKETATYDPADATATYEGRWAGFALGRDLDTMWTSYIVYRPEEAISGGISMTGGVLKPGRYKFRLFTDGRPVTIKLPWSGPDVTLRPDAPVNVTIQADRVPMRGGGNTDAIAFPLDGKVGADIGVSAHLDALYTGQFRTELCLGGRTPDTCTGAPDRLTEGGAGIALNGITTGMSEGHYRLATKGRYARAQVTGTAVGFFTVLSVRFDP